MLLAQDGSTTRLCECLAGGTVSVRLLAQERTTELPAPLASVLPGSIFMRRLIALEARGHVLMDSLSFIALEGLAQDMRHALEEGVTPIGHLLARLWTRREFRSHDTQLFEQLWSQVGLADPAASRSYAVVTPKASLMVIAETFRRGLVVACQDAASTG